MCYKYLNLNLLRINGLVTIDSIFSRVQALVKVLPMTDTHEEMHRLMQVFAQN